MENILKEILIWRVKMANKVVICGLDTSSLPKLKNTEIEALLKRIKSGDELARDEFIVANLRLVLSIVQRFVGKRDKADDMFQIGCVGLMKAIDNFDLSLNVKFSTYAVPMIIGEIKRYLRDNTPLRISRSLRDIAYKALQVKDILTKKQGKEPTVEEISALINVPTVDINQALDAISDTISLSEPVYQDSNDTVIVLDQISDSKNNESTLSENLALKQAINKLSPREKEILNLRYFIGKTQVEVSDLVGISQAQVSRLEKCALESIKKQIT